MPLAARLLPFPRIRRLAGLRSMAILLAAIVIGGAGRAASVLKYNMFVAQIGCAAFGVLALSFFGPGWLARGAALSACIAFMIITSASHPPAASLPLLFIDGPKFHNLQFWYALFPGAAGCIVLCLIIIEGLSVCTRDP